MHTLVSNVLRRLISLVGLISTGEGQAANHLYALANCSLY
jgi:hypothetical protein